MNRTRQTLKEPLLHFLLIGGGLLLLYGMMNDTEEENPNRIVGSPGQVEMLAANFSRTRMRQPPPDELTHIVNEHVRDEVFYREAIEVAFSFGLLHGLGFAGRLAISACCNTGSPWRC